MTDQPRVTTPASDVSVHRALPAEVDAIAALTVEALRAQPAELLPPGVLDEVDTADVAADWREAVTAPPSPRHLVLTALEGDEVVGYALAAPSQDPDAAADGTSAEVLDLVVRADRTRRGHGSRLLAALVDTLRGNGCSEVAEWVPIGDDARRAFLVSAGFAADGASRTLEGGPGTASLRQVRLSARID
ncbi:MAG TPA: GNAT family N-acetyltransferase [Candidatus Angelobacter sp.]|nr:GNAT family N-acetyltransferase [Candidatus Angelobacter sp.]